MQDKISIGPVTLVQLVGLSAKPRIASVQADGAVRPADAPPSSAVAGLGDGLSQVVNEIAGSFLNLKQVQSLNLVAENGGARIALEAGVDRPIADASAPASAVDPSTFDKLVPENSPAGNAAVFFAGTVDGSGDVLQATIESVGIITDDSIIEFSATGAAESAAYAPIDLVDPFLSVRADNSVFDLPIATLQMTGHPELNSPGFQDGIAAPSGSDAVPPI
jgi:hypothetical protein